MSKKFRQWRLPNINQEFIFLTCILQGKPPFDFLTASPTTYDLLSVPSSPMTLWTPVFLWYNSVNMWMKRKWFISHNIFEECHCFCFPVWCRLAAMMENLYTRHGFPIAYHHHHNNTGTDEGLLSLVVVLGSSVSLVGLVFAFITYR